jgi:hypothetical protein
MEFPTQQNWSCQLGTARWYACNGIYSVVLQDCQLRPYLADNTGSRSISKVKLPRAPLVLRFVRTWESAGAVVFLYSIASFQINKVRLFYFRLGYSCPICELFGSIRKLNRFEIGSAVPGCQRNLNPSPEAEDGSTPLKPRDYRKHATMKTIWILGLFPTSPFLSYRSFYDCSISTD